MSRYGAANPDHWSQDYVRYPYAFTVDRRCCHPPASGPRPAACRAHLDAREGGLLRRRRLSPRDPGLHGAGRRPDGHRHGRQPASRPAAGIQQRTACPRRLLDGARAESEQREQPVFHLLRRRALPRQSVHRLGRSDRWHGQCRRAAQGRAAARAGQDRQSDCKLILSLSHRERVAKTWRVAPRRSWVRGCDGADNTSVYPVIQVRLARKLASLPILLPTGEGWVFTVPKTHSAARTRRPSLP